MFRVEDLDSSQRQSHEGFLSKQSPKAGGGWQRRWFVLDGPAATLSYFKEKDVRTLFEELDADGSGFLDSSEIEELCKQMGRKLSKKELAKAMTEIDADGNDEVSFSEFEAWWTLNGGRAADKRKPAGVIELSSVQRLVCIGADDLELTTDRRVYKLRADPGESILWQRLIGECLPTAAAERRAMKLRRALDGTCDDAMMHQAHFLEIGHIGILWRPFSAPSGKVFAVVQAVEDGSPGQQQGVRPGHLLCEVSGAPMAGVSFADTMVAIQSVSRPMTLGFSCIIDDAAKQLLMRPPAAVAVKKGWVVLIQQVGTRDRRFCVADTRGLHFFKNDKDAVTDERGETLLRHAEFTMPHTTISFLPLQSDTCQVRLANAERGAISLECDVVDELREWVTAVSDSCELLTGLRPAHAEAIEDALLTLSGSFEELPPPPIPWGAPTAYVCIKRCQVRAAEATNSSILGFLSEGQDIHVLEHREDADGSIRIRIDFEDQKGWVQSATSIASPLPAIPIPANAEAASKQGFLSKQSPKAGGGWQRRWFVLDGPAATLSYFKEKDVRTLFEELDADGSGFLDSSEIEELCKQMGRKLSKKELAKAMTEIDADGNDEVSFSEFEAWWTLNGGRAADKRKPAGVIELAHITDIRLVAKKILLLSDERSYTLAADTKDEAVAWRVALCDATPGVYTRTVVSFSNHVRDSDQVASAFKIQAAFRGRQARRAAAVARASIPSKHSPAETSATATSECLPTNHRVETPGLACAECSAVDANTWTAEALEALDEDAAVELCEMQGLPWASMTDLEEVQTALKCHFGVVMDLPPMQAATADSIEPYQSAAHTDLKVREPVAVQNSYPLGIDAEVDRVAELQGLRLRELEKIAQDFGLEQWEIDEALDSDRPKQALTALIILTQDEAGTDVSTATRLPSLHNVGNNPTELDASVLVPQRVEKSTAVEEEECKKDSQPSSDPAVDGSARSTDVMESADLAQAAAVPTKKKKNTGVEVEVKAYSQLPSDPVVVLSARSTAVMESTDPALAATAPASDWMMESAGSDGIAAGTRVPEPMTADVQAAPTTYKASTRPSPIATPFAMPRVSERAIDWLSEHVYPQLRHGLTALNDARCNSVSTAIQDPLRFLADVLQRSTEVAAPVVLGRPSVASTSMLSYCATVRPALLDALIAVNTERPHNAVAFVAERLRQASKQDREL